MKTISKESFAGNAKLISALLCVTLTLLSWQLAFARENPAFKVRALINDGKKVKERDAILKFSENSFASLTRRKKTLIKEFNYADVVGADYSYAEEPYLSKTGAMAATLFLGMLAVPLFFLKKKEHWLSVRTANDYLVLRLDGKSCRKILLEFAARRIRVKSFGEGVNEAIP